MVVPKGDWALKAAVAALVTLLGCGDDGGPGDGGVADAATDSAADGGSRVTPPDIPWLAEGVPPIMIAPCPEGWREVTGGDVTECAPYPELGPEACDAGEAHFLGESTCRPIGDPCPEGDYATTLPADGTTIYVKADAATGGDGSLGSPFGGLSDVNWLSLAAGTTVALAKGSYAGTVPLRAGVRVIGACARDTVLTGIDAPVPAVVTVTSAGEPATVRNLSIVGPPQMGVQVNDGRALVLEGVLLDRTIAAGLLVLGTGTVVTLSDTVIRSTLRRGDLQTFGRGIDVEQGAHLEASRLIVSDNSEFGIFVGGDDTSATLADAVVRDTQPRSRDGNSGRGIVVDGGAHVDGSRMLIAGNHDVGVMVRLSGSTVTLSDSIIRNTQLRPTGGVGGRGVNIEDGASFEGTRVVIADNHSVGVFAGRAGATVTLTDVVVRGTMPEGNGLGPGRGIAVRDAARLEATRLLVTQNHQVGVVVIEEGTTAILSDTVVRETQPEASLGAAGRGISVQWGAHLDGSRLVIVRNHEVGIFVGSTGTTADLADVVVRDTQPQRSDDQHGTAVQLQEGGRLDGARLHIDGAASIGLNLVAGAEAVLEDIAITHVVKAACEATTCPMRANGFATAAVGSTLRMTRFEFRDAATCGVFLAPYAPSGEAPSLDLRSGVIAESAIGACIQVDGYDLDRLTDDVEYRDNGTNLDSTTLPVPDTLDTAGF